MQLTDRTQSPNAYNSPLNVQVFAADIEAQGNLEIRDAALDLGGASPPMSNVGGDRWEAVAALPACDEVVPYRFVVHYDDRGDTSPPFSRRVFPETGQFVRRIINQPAECAERPTLGSRAFVVDSTFDQMDAVPGDGVCSTTADSTSSESQCSLRAAIMEANALPGLNLIAIRDGRYRLELSGPEGRDRPDATVGDLDITESVVIQHDTTWSECAASLDVFLDPLSSPPYRDTPSTTTGVTKIDANQIDRVLDIYSSSSESPTEVYLYCLHLLGGLRRGDPMGLGGRERGGGILNRATLLLDRVAVTENRLTGASSGAGIHNAGRLVIRESALLHNDGDRGGAAFGGTSGGAIYNEGGGTVSIDRSVSAFNTAARGPAIMNDRRLDDNRAVISAGQISLTNTTVTDHRGGDSAGTLASAILNYGSLRISWSSFRESREPVLETSIGRTYVGNSILYGISQSPCARGARGISSLGGNWFSHNNCVIVPVSGDIERRPRGTTERLEDNGGFTPTQRLFEPSPEEDWADIPVDQAGTGLPLCPAADQRGFFRPADGDGDGVAVCDPGAFELNASAPSS